MAVWPVSLPQLPLAGRYQETFPNTNLRTPMEMGPPKVRKRFIANVTPLDVAFKLTTAQVATFETFYKTDCSYGALSFTWVNPRTGVSASIRFQDVPKVSHDEGGIWDVTCKMEIMP